jgi:hypothetical protein
MKAFEPKSQKGKDTMAYIKMLLDTGYKGNIIKAAGEFRDRWEENQLPEGITIEEDENGLPIIKTELL